MDFKSFRKEINSSNASVRELVNDIFLKIDSKDPEINSYICTTKENAIAQAEKIDKLIQKEQILPLLAGMPIAIKDYQTVNGSSFLQRTKVCLMSLGPSSERSLINEEIFSFKLRLVIKGPYQYVVFGSSVSILAHQANPSLFPKFLIKLLWPFRPSILVKFYTIL